MLPSSGNLIRLGKRQSAFLGIPGGTRVLAGPACDRSKALPLRRDRDRRAFQVAGPLDDRSGPDLDPWRPDRAAHPTCRPELDPLPGADLPLHLPSDLQDVDVNDAPDSGLLPNDEGSATDAWALHVPIDAEDPPDLQLPPPLGPGPEIGRYPAEVLVRWAAPLLSTSFPDPAWRLMATLPEPTIQDNRSPLTRPDAPQQTVPPALALRPAPSLCREPAERSLSASPHRRPSP